MDEARGSPFRQPDAANWPPAVEYTFFKKTPVPKPKPIIDNLLDDCSRMIIGGAAKTYKSWVMSEQAVCVACGAPWWGFTTHRAHVLYVNFELKDYYIQRRFRDIEGFKGLSIAQDQLLIWNLWNENAPLYQFESELVRLIQLHAILIVFIDPFYSLLGDSDERISAELMPILTMFGRINRLTGATVVCAAHFTKGNQAQKDPIDRISGGGSLNRHPDCLMTLTKHQSDQAFTVDFVCRDFPPINPFVVQWQHPLLARTDLNPQDLKTSGRSPLYNPDQILAVLSDYDDEFNSKELQIKVFEETGMSRPVFYRLFDSLQKEKKVFRSKTTAKWNLGIVS